MTLIYLRRFPRPTLSVGISGAVAGLLGTALPVIELPASGKPYLRGITKPCHPEAAPGGSAPPEPVVEPETGFRAADPRNRRFQRSARD